MIATDTMVGTEFGPYLIKEFVGRGGMGVVYRAEHRELRRSVALKVLAPELAENVSFRDRFVRESRLAASLDHPNVIPIYDASEIDGVYFIAMRYVDGLDLKQVLLSQPSQPLDVERTISIVSQIAGALDAAHQHGLVHRDVKPGNILTVAGSDHCYLTDFGLTKSARSNSGFTATGHFVGTADYCAPEQIQGKPIDARTDVYSLGCVLFECLTGSPPYARENDVAVMYAHIHEPPPRVTDWRPELPTGLDQVVATAMAKSVDARYPSPSAIAAAARTALEVSTGRSLPTVPLPNSVETGPSSRRFEAAVLPTGGQTVQDEVPPPPYSPAAPPYGPPPPQPPAPVSGGKQRPLTAIAVIAAAIILGLGGTGAALILTNKKHNSTTAGSPSRPTTTNPNPSPTHVKPNPTSPGTHTAPTTPSAPTQGSAGEETQASQAVMAYWNAIGNGDYPTAYSYYTHPLTDHFDESSWVQSHQDEGIQSASANVGTATVSGDSASVQLIGADTISQKDGEFCFAGSYDLAKVGGAWKISAVHLTRHTGACG